MVVYEINEQNPQQRLIDKAVISLKEGGVIVYPTDTVYAYGCDIREKHAIERIYAIKKIPKNKPLSFVFSDINQLHEYVRNISDQAFKIMKRACPGPYTFIFKAAKLVPKIAITNQKTIGVRIPENRITLALVNTLGSPILSASVSTEDGKYVIDPVELEKRHRNEVDIIISSGPKYSDPSSIIDFSDGGIRIVRHGKGELFFV